MTKIDTKDKKILQELAKDSRIPLTTLAKKVKLSREVVDYRIKRLVKNNVIADFITEIDEKRLGYERYIVSMILRNSDSSKEQEIVNFIMDHELVSWTTIPTGRWTLIFDFLAKDFGQVKNFLDELKNKYTTNILEYDVSPQIVYKHFNTKYYGINNEALSVKETEHKIDSVDLRLLRKLSNNSRIGYVELSKELNLTPNAIKNRIKALIKSKIIKNFFIHPNKEKLGLKQYYMQLRYINQTKEHETQIINYVERHPNMNAYYIPLDFWGIEIGVFVKDRVELKSIVSDIKTRFGNEVRFKDTLLFYEEPKSNYLPKGVFSEQG